jgi:hypothetical protein
MQTVNSLKSKLIDHWGQPVKNVNNLGFTNGGISQSPKVFAKTQGSVVKLKKVIED